MNQKTLVYTAALASGSILLGGLAYYLYNKLTSTKKYKGNLILDLTVIPFH